jgi:hypothetical protein
VAHFAVRREEAMIDIDDDRALGAEGADVATVARAQIRACPTTSDEVTPDEAGETERPSR